MSPADLVLILILGAILVLAVALIVRRKRRGDGCCGECGACDACRRGGKNR